MTDLVDLMRAPPVIRQVDSDGTVVQGEPDETLTLPHPRMAWSLCRIELHRHDDGTWMWSVGVAGGGYRVGPKWGRFALTRDDALHYARIELLAKLEGMKGRENAWYITPAFLHRMIDWAERQA